MNRHQFAKIKRQIIKSSSYSILIHF